MEHKIDEIIPYNFEGEDIYLKVTPTKDSSCRNCFFYLNYNCSSCSTIRDIIGQCDNNLRTDKTPIIFTSVVKNTVNSNKQSSGIYKKDVLGKWININDINPIEIKDLKRGNYVILRIAYNNSMNFDYKLAYVDFIKDGKVNFHIQDINIARASIQITDFCILPDYISYNFYKINNK